ncbi:MAG: response regulator [Chloroflexi bacterium]|nr:response regulator [Chloroflexota bacterium]
MSDHILVVDDDPWIRDLVELALSGEGYRVATAENGCEALRLVDEDPPRLILLDMRMPVLDGWQFAERYRQKPEPRAPIVCITAAVDAPRSSAEISAAAVLEKPFNLDDLFRVVDQLV